jgi:aspartate/methionine/tyrosine aminotransferase
MQQPVLGNVCSVAQKAAEAALLGPQECVRDMREYYRARRDQAVRLLESAGLPTWKPAGAFYIMIDVAAADTMTFARDLLLRQKVAVAPGETFGPGGRGLVRVALCVSEDVLNAGLGRLIEVIKQPRGPVVHPASPG